MLHFHSLKPDSFNTGLPPELSPIPCLLLVRLLQAFVSQVSLQLPGFENEDYGLLLYGLASLGQPLSPQQLARFAAESGRKLYGLSGEGLGLLVWGLAQYDYEMPDAEEWWAGIQATNWHTSRHSNMMTEYMICLALRQNCFMLVLVLVSSRSLRLHCLLQRCCLRALQARPAAKQHAWRMPQTRHCCALSRRRWSKLFEECDSKWQSMTLRGCALMLVGLAQLGPRHLPPGEWEAAWVSRYKAVSIKPTSWHGLLLGVRLAAGLEPGEQLQLTPWLNALLLKLGRAWGLQPAELEDGLAAVLGEVDVQVEAAAEAAAVLGAAGDMESSNAGATLVLGSMHSAVGHLQLGRGSVEPTSAAAVLL